jgi:septal ring factor EnvC (AmiA/AmiB activator)
VVAVLAALAGGAVTNAAVDREGELRRLRQSIEESRRRVASYELEQRGLLETIEALDRSAAELGRAVSRAAERADEARAKLVAIQAEAAQLADDLERTRRVMAQRAVALYRAGEMGALPILFSAEGMQEFLSRVYALRLLLVHDAELLVLHREQEQALGVAQEEAKHAAVKHGEAAEHLKQRSRELSSERRAKRRVATSLHESRSAERAALVELETAARALEETIANLRRAPALRSSPEGPEFRSLRGELKPPVAAPVVSEFGRVIDSRFRTEGFRKGIDFESAVGTPVQAVAAGSVAFAGWFRGYGRLVILDHGDRYFTIYGHLDRIAVSVGQSLAARQILGAAGDTGSLVGPRLYFEVRRGEKPLDPRRWLRLQGAG